MAKRPRSAPAKPKRRLVPVRYSRGVVRKHCVPIAVVLLAAGLCACRYDPTKEPENLPAIPQLQLTRVSDEARTAMENARERVMQYPGDALLNGEFGMVLHAHRRFQEAAVMYDRARKIHTVVFRWEYYRGMVLSELNEVAEAGASFNRALELRENEPNALLALAQLYFKSAKLADNQALEAEGEKILERLLETNPDYVMGHLVKAARLEQAGKEREAIAVYEGLLESGPSFSLGHQSIARLYEKLGDHDLAERHEALAQQSPSALPPNQNDWMAAVNRLALTNMDHAARGQMLLQNHLIAPAAEQFELAVADDPKNVSYRVNLVALYGMARNVEKAREHYQAALRIGGADAKVHLNMGTIYLGAKQLEEAEAAYNRALAADGTTIKAHLGLARIALFRENPAKAESFVRQAMALEPLSPLVHQELVNVLRVQGKLDEAIAVAEKGVGYSEGRTAVRLLRTLADLEHEKGDNAAAKAALERARAEAERSENNVDLALIDAHLADLEELDAAP